MNSGLRSLNIQNTQIASIFRNLESKRVQGSWGSQRLLSSLWFQRVSFHPRHWECVRLGSYADRNAAFLIVFRTSKSVFDSVNGTDWQLWSLFRDPECEPGRSTVYEIKNFKARDYCGRWYLVQSRIIVRMNAARQMVTCELHFQESGFPACRLRSSPWFIGNGSKFMEFWDGLYDLNARIFKFTHWYGHFQTLWRWAK
jgi:hypothetical protein